MSHEELNRLFIEQGSQIKPGDKIRWKDYEISEEFRNSIVGFVKESVDDYNKDPTNEGTLQNAFCSFILRLFHKLDFVVRYFCGEFEIQTSNKKVREDGAKVGYEFIKGGYFGSIYVGYGEDLEELDRQAFEENTKSNFSLDGVTGKIRLFTASKGNSKNTFTSVFSGQKSLPLEEHQIRRLVKCENKGFYNWMAWGNLWYKWIKDMDRVRQSAYALSKNVIITPKNNAEYQNIQKQFENNDCFIKRDGNQLDDGDDNAAMGKTKFEEIIFMPRETPMAMIEVFNRLLEADAAHLGYAGRADSQKKERINAGENFPHQKVVSNVRSYYLTSLNLFFDEARKKGGEEVIPNDLKVVAANQTFAEGLPHFQHGGTFNNFDKFGSGTINKFNRFNKFGDDNRGND